MSNEKDIAEKNFESINEIFADIFNVLAFDGEQVIHPTDLVDTATESQLKVDDELHEQERDVAKLWVRPEGNIVLSLCGLENQSAQDRDMVLRCISYDGASYKKQVNQHNSKDEERIPTYPAVTLVLYFGKNPWNVPKTLFESFEVEIDSKLKPFVQDYRANIIDVPRLQAEKVDLCKSDFKYVVDWFIHTTDTAAERNFADGKIKHGDEFVKLMVALTGDKRFASVYNEFRKAEGKEEIKMCELIDKLEARGEARGEKNGFEKGQYETAVRMFRKGYNDAQVKDILPDVSLEKLAEAKKEAQKHNS